MSNASNSNKGRGTHRKAASARGSAARHARASGRSTSTKRTRASKKGTGTRHASSGRRASTRTASGPRNGRSRSAQGTPKNRAPSRSSTARHNHKGTRHRLGKTVALAVAVAAGLALLLRYLGLYAGFTGMSPARVSMGVSDPALAYTNPFAWGQLWTDARGRYHYTVDGTDASRAGIDVSEHQGAIDWPSVRADGVEFAYVRIGYRGSKTGVVYRDARYRQNMQEARAAGLDVGVYFYSEATSAEEARAEAAFVLQELGNAPLEYPVAFDYEPTGNDADRIAGLSSAQMNTIAAAFCDAIEASGRTAVVYGNASDLARMQAQNLARFGYWYASYTARPTVDLAFGLWQYSSTGSVAGISTPVDLDLDLTQPLAAYLQSQEAKEGE